MRLHVEQWGEGGRTAVLVHGASDDHTTWHRLAPRLAAQGFRVLAPDLRGHGRSDRADSYRLADFAADLVASLPERADVVISHSLGCLAVGLAAEQLVPRSLVYLDPPWRTTPPGTDAPPSAWDAIDSEVDAASTSRMDLALLQWIPDRLLEEVPSAIPAALVAPTLVVQPEPGGLVDPAVRDRLLRAGFAFTALPGVGHVMHRDDLDALAGVLESWISSGVSQQAH